MDYREVYQEWLENPYFDDSTKEELRAVEKDEKEIREYRVDQLKFKPRRKKEKVVVDAELKQLEALEKREGKSKLDDN